MFTPERLVLARKRRRMTLAALASAAGISQQSITAFENHRKKPSAETLSSLAKSLNYPESFFSAPPPVEMQVDAVSFRAPSKMSALERDSALSAGVMAENLNSWLEARFKLPKPNVPTFPHLDPEESSIRIRSLWGLGEAPVPNMVHLLEANGVRVFSLASDCLEIDAFSTIKRGTPYVFLNTRKSGERGRFDAAHELGHLTLHCEHRVPKGRDSESEANQFASAFLMPAAGIAAQQLRNASVERILSAKRRWGVSALALTYRLRTLDLLSQWRYTQIMKELSRRGYRRSEPDSSMVRENSQLLTKVFDVLRGKGVTPSEVSKDLCITLEELSNYVFGLVPVGVEGGGEVVHSVRPSLELVRGDGRPGRSEREPRASDLLEAGPRGEWSEPLK